MIYFSFKYHYISK